MVDSRIGQTPTHEAGMGEEQGAERTATEAGKPSAEYAARADRQHGVGEYDRHLVAVQEYLAHLTARTGLEAEHARFVGIGMMQALAQHL